LGCSHLLRKFHYDPNTGVLVGVTTEITIAATDPDGDPLTYSWSVSNGSVTWDGPAALWQRELRNGNVVDGSITVTVADGRGGSASFTYSDSCPVP
jgi:hypothetical protein